MAKDLGSGENLVAEAAPFTFHSNDTDEICKVPFVYVPNLIAKVADMVAAYQGYSNIAFLKKKGHQYLYST